ncbi:MAG: Holliday junction resolvase RuvX [candidate division Zixibacteria bacterium]|nr:Holliday junction resolvase RuvX [candidate division Zixibacteria bacterium]
MRILGIDYGRRRIGLAITDPNGLMATPLETMLFDDAKNIAHIQKIIADEEVEMIIIGDPVRDDGIEAELHSEIISFAEKLGRETGLEIKFIDEYYSSGIATGKFHDAGLKMKGNKGIIDQLAAAELLQWYLDSLK